MTPLYVKDRPEISDEGLIGSSMRSSVSKNGFQTLRRQTPDPAGRSKPQEEFRVVEHTAPMLSLDATREESEIRRFDERTRKSLSGKVRYPLEEKFDGASVELVYQSGILKRAVTRGDGQHGKKITEKHEDPFARFL